MSEIEEKVTCPLGSKCFEIKDNTPYRCAWHIKMAGEDAQGERHDEWGCAIAWQPILQTEMANTNRGQTAAIESLRNETIKRQDIALSMAQDMSKNDAKVINPK